MQAINISINAYSEKMFNKSITYKDYHGALAASVV